MGQERENLREIGEYFIIAEYKKIFEQAYVAVWDLLNQFPELNYHNLTHTVNYVLPWAIKIGKGEGLSEKELLLLAVACLFHDTGYAVRKEGNETIGAVSAWSYCLESNINLLIENADIISKTILATDLKKEPSTLMEKIIRDADLSVLGLPEFWEINEQLRQEEREVDVGRWFNNQFKFIQQHEWQTTSAKQLLDEGRRLNVSKGEWMSGYVNSRSLIRFGANELNNRLPVGEMVKNLSRGIYTDTIGSNSYSQDDKVGSVAIRLNGLTGLLPRSVNVVAYLDKGFVGKHDEWKVMWINDVSHDFNLLHIWVNPDNGLIVTVEFRLYRNNILTIRIVNEEEMVKFWKLVSDKDKLAELEVLR